MPNRSLSPTVPGPLLSVRDLSVRYRRWRGADRIAVDGVSFDIRPGEVVGLVGESGSGKSSIVSAVAGSGRSRRRVLGGQVWLDGSNLIEGRDARVRDVGVVPPLASAATSGVGTQLVGVLRRHRGLDRGQARVEAERLLRRVGLPGADRDLRARPIEMSDGMRQRALLALALARRPRLLIADEPTTALDVTVQAQILHLMGEIVAELGIALLLLTHDLAVAAGLCDRINVLCSGRVVEEAERHRLFATPRHPYTHGLIGSVPRVDPDNDDGIPVIHGSVDDHLAWTDGCAFAPRCPRATEHCRTTPPPVEAVASRLLRCHNPVPATST